MVIRAVDANDLPQLSELMLEYAEDFYNQPDPGTRAVKNHIAYLLLHPDMGEQWVAEDRRTFGPYEDLQPYILPLLWKASHNKGYGKSTVMRSSAWKPL